MPPVRHLILTRAADRRLAIARDLVASRGGEIVIVGASRGAADDFARSIAARKAATFGLHRFSLPQVASRVARLDAARDGVSPAGRLMIEAVTAHASHDRAGMFSYFAPVADLPGFPRAVRATLTELRLAVVTSEDLKGVPSVGNDLAALLDAYQGALKSFTVSDVADLYARATRVLLEDAPSFLRQTLVLLDVPMRSRAVHQFIAALIEASANTVVTTPVDDHESRSFFADRGCAVAEEEDEPGNALSRVRQHLFALDVPLGAKDDSVRFFSAPGEGREAVEIARAVLQEARRGVPFDEVAVLLRNPAHYAPHITSAFRRAGIPAFFAEGARRPDPAGRAFLALLTCGAENYSAKRFAEYLSLGQVPLAPATGAAPELPDDEVLRELLGLPDEKSAGAEAEEAPLREPWKWEEIIVEAAVLGGADRWQRRLSGLEREYEIRLKSLLAEDPSAPQADALRRDIGRLVQLREFAIPVVASLQALAEAKTWRPWLDGLEALAWRTVKEPSRVLRALAELRPMEDIGPVTFSDVIAVLRDRLSALERPQPSHRFGRVFVAPLEHACGRAFRIVFVPGVAERAFPRRPKEDPLLLDRARSTLAAHLVCQDARASRERLLLQLAAGAASERLILSYPRMEVREGRPRVSSFYALDVIRAVSGGIPDYEAVEKEAWAEVGATMAWPAPDRAIDAIDALEYDLATLRPLLMAAEPKEVRGRANYLVQLHPMLGRALRTRRARWGTKWGQADGLFDVSETVRHALDALSLRATPYSPSALQRFAACPYSFYLSAIARLSTREEPERIETLDPLTRGTLVHEIYAAVLRRLQSDGLLPLPPAQVARARDVADRVFEEFAAAAYDALAPAVDLVWKTTITAIRTDMHIWLGRIADVSDWIPAYFELGFGVEGRTDLDPASTIAPVIVGNGFQLRGSIDLVERSADNALLRIRDYKTGQDSTKKKLVVGNGEVLQPTLYALAAEQLLGQSVVEGQLWYASSRGDFGERTVKLTTGSRRDVTQVLETIDEALRKGALPAAPRKDACTNCDFRRICGPYEETRVRGKTVPIESLLRIRGLP